MGHPTCHGSSNKCVNIIRVFCDCYCISVRTTSWESHVSLDMSTHYGAELYAQFSDSWLNLFTLSNHYILLHEVANSNSLPWPGEHKECRWFCRMRAP
jgi:hypothetical protein